MDNSAKWNEKIMKKKNCFKGTQSMNFGWRLKSSILIFRSAINSVKKEKHKDTNQDA